MDAPRIARWKVCQTPFPKANRYFAAAARKTIRIRHEAIAV